MWDLPGLGIEPVSPALAGGFLATRPPGKSSISSLKSVTPRSSGGLRSRSRALVLSLLPGMSIHPSLKVIFQGQALGPFWETALKIPFLLVLRVWFGPYLCTGLFHASCLFTH